MEDDTFGGEYTRQINHLFIMNELIAKKLLEKFNDGIKKEGYSITYVNSENPPSFCYSTGIFKNFHIPEVFISSLPPGLCSELIENYLSHFRNNGNIPINKRLEYLTDRFPVYLIEVPSSNLTEYVLGSINFYKDESFEYVQVIYPDTNGYFPNEPRYNYDQEIMGEFNV